MSFLKKILMLAMIVIISFMLYVFVIGLAMGIQPGQAVSAILSPATPDSLSQIADSLKSTADSTSDSTAIAPDSSAKIQLSLLDDSLALLLSSIKSQQADIEKMKSEAIKRSEVDKTEDENKLYTLAKMYEGIDPVQLADVFSKMDDSLVIRILPKMKSAKAGKIIESMPADRAAAISSRLLGKSN